MGHTSKTEKHPEKQLWDELKHVKAGMLGVEGSHSHMQPMGHMTDPEHGRLWFFTSKDSDLYREVGSSAHAHFCVIGKGQDYHACLAGELSENHSPTKKEELWNDMAAAWWSDVNDPDLALLKFELADAAIWASTKNPVRFAWEINRAKHSDDHAPDIGARAHVDFEASKGSDSREQSGKRV